MSRLSFGLPGQISSELLAGIAVKIYDEETQEFVASTNESDGYAFQVIDNNDGTYFVDGLPMKVYSFYVGSDQVPQDELSFHAFFNEEGIAHFKDAGDDGQKIWHHKLDDMASDPQKVWSSNKISQELGSKANASALQNYSPIGHNHAADYAEIDHAHSGVYSPVDHNHDNQFQVDDFYIDATGKVRVKLVFNDPSILDPNKTLNQNLERLENAIRNGVANTPLIDLEGRESHLGTVNLTHAAGEIYYGINATSGKAGIYARVCTQKDGSGAPIAWAIIPLGEANYTIPGGA